MPDMTGSERAFVGAIINGEARATDSGLTAGMFTNSFCRQAFSACLQLEAQGKTADLVTLCDLGTLDAPQLIEMTMEAAPVVSIAAQHAGNIRESAMRRQIAKVCTDAAMAALDGDRTLTDTLSKLRTAIDKASARVASDGYTSGTDAMLDLWMYLEGGMQKEALSTGLPRLNAALNGGISGGKLVVIGARPAVGKSALMGFMTVQALKMGKRVLIDSLEMSTRENAERLLANVSGVSVGAMEQKNLSEGDWLRLAEGLSLLPGERYRFTKHAITVPALRTQALKMRADGGLDMIVVDYLQLMTAAGKTSSRAEAVGEISRSLKLLALELDVPIVVGAQVNRASTMGEERPPRLSELRESGSIEQDADLVLMLHAPKTNEPGRELIIAKNRQGRTGVLDLLFDGGRMMFAEAK